MTCGYMEGVMSHGYYNEGGLWLDVRDETVVKTSSKRGRRPRWMNMRILFTTPLNLAGTPLPISMLPTLRHTLSYIKDI